ncbi:MAG: molybdenum cofactor guanylyltransferase [Gemmatimonadota bacterium]
MTHRLIAKPFEAGAGSAGRPGPLGAILAGGTSRRFGGRPKALAEVGGRPILERVRDALDTVAEDVVLIANDPAPYSPFDLLILGDAFEGVGPLAGLHAALAWARERGLPGALCVACDMPFVSADVLRTVWARARETGANVVAPWSAGPRGVEPLCAYYAVASLETIAGRARARAGELVELLDALGAEVLPREEVEAMGDPERLFMNVNDSAGLERARALAAPAPTTAPAPSPGVARRPDHP